MFVIALQTMSLLFTRHVAWCRISGIQSGFVLPVESRWDSCIQGDLQSCSPDGRITQERLQVKASWPLWCSHSLVLVVMCQSYTCHKWRGVGTRGRASVIVRQWRMMCVGGVGGVGGGIGGIGGGKQIGCQRMEVDVRPKDLLTKCTFAAIGFVQRPCYIPLLRS